MIYIGTDFKEVDMKKTIYILAGIMSFILATSAFAQLPANPWAPNPNDGYLGDNIANNDPTHVPVYEDTSNGGEILAVDPWARARDKSGKKTWRGSANHGKLNFTGEATTYGTATGQEMIAPEVNRHNMLVMTQHFRDLGYKIPDSYDQNIKDMPKNYGRKLRKAYDEVGTTENPLDLMFAGFLDVAEQGTGLDMENLLFNSIDILGTD